ncbi:MAG: BamA/TamA family outer membrane protein [Rubricoccaceae bacterium]
MLRLLLLPFVCALSLSVPAAAQAPLTLANDSTWVRSLEFDISGRAAFDEADLQLQIATAARPSRFLLWGGGERSAYPLDPFELAKDVVRLENHFGRNGFPRAEGDFQVELDTASNSAAVIIEIDAGPPRLIRDVVFRGPGQADVLDQLAPSLHTTWTDFTGSTTLRTGDRLSDFGLVTLRGQTIGWLRDRGYAFADVGVEAFPDETGLLADVRLKVNAGPRARIDSIQVDGAESVTPDVVTRELPFNEGDWFSASELTDGQREIFGLNLFQLAVVNATEGQPRDSTVSILARVREGPTRVVNAFGGYFTEGGITARGSITHRNFLGGARSITAGGEARTGWLGTETTPRGTDIRDLQASISLRQPYVFDRRLSLTAQPFYRLRDDEIENSRAAGATGTLLFTRSALETVSFTTGYQFRRLINAQTSLGLVDPTSSTDTDSLKTENLRSQTFQLGLDATWGRLDNTLQPRRGLVIRPSASYIPGPSLATVRGRLAVTALYPFNDRIGVAIRATAGTISALGSTSFNSSDEYILLRDQLFYAGGTSDVRGWSSTRLGPKAFSVIRLPDLDPQGNPIVDDQGNPIFEDEVRFTPRDPSDVNYVGVGGRSKLSGSVQLNLPFPGLGSLWGTNLFMDAGRVVSPSSVPSALLRATGNPADASLADVLDRESAVRLGAGFGIQYLSPVGFVSLALGYKLNPSDLDLRRAADVYCGSGFVGNDLPDVETCTGGYIGARNANTAFDIDDIEPISKIFGVIPRAQIHFTIGQTF